MRGSFFCYAGLSHTTFGPLFRCFVTPSFALLLLPVVCSCSTGISLYLGYMLTNHIVVPAVQSILFENGPICPGRPIVQINLTSLSNNVDLICIKNKFHGGSQ